jgi:hypothetical protein
MRTLILTEEEECDYDALFVTIDDGDSDVIPSSGAHAIALCESVGVLLALCHDANAYRGSGKWLSAGRHAANRLRELFGPPITLIT